MKKKPLSGGMGPYLQMVGAHFVEVFNNFALKDHGVESSETSSTPFPGQELSLEDIWEKWGLKHQPPHFSTEFVNLKLNSHGPPNYPHQNYPPPETKI